MATREIQLGKFGATEKFVENLKNQFKSCENVKISVLKSCCRDREELQKITDKLLDLLGKNYTARIIGYTIVIKKWRKAVRK